jgi:type II secretory pathway pseudopilin PulG
MPYEQVFPSMYAALRAQPKAAFTLIEILSAVTIMAALIAVATFFIVSYISYAQLNSDKQTLTVLNDTLTRYKTGGGGVTALTVTAPIAHVLAALQAPINWAGGLTHQVWRGGSTYPGRSIDALGSGAQYHFTRFNTYTSESGGVSTPLPPPHFVAVSSTTTNSAYSDDGANWTAGTVPFGNTVSYGGVAYGGGKYVIASATGTSAAYSTDGITWTTTTTPCTSGTVVLKYCNDKFLAVGFNQSGYSTDGANWINISSSPILGRNWNALGYGNGTYVVIGTVGQLCYSSDGITWTAGAIPSLTYYACAYGGGKFVAVGTNTASCSYSSDGINWSSGSMPSSANWRSVAYGNGRFVSVSQGSGSTKGAYSMDGVNWTAVVLPVGANWVSLAYVNGLFVTVASSATNALTSPDGITWTSATLPTSGAWRVNGY